ncbi:unnamed protein product (macronuclear) [Paramecium tetraurelia]|uniref:Uncharacterized protein n=1 Tax=Paramecium tetraurelia TaxID=5888 RepID=A0CFA3_PARTE|nr:uncharacterized protein GSPATT00037909001 [Paramecium tetraurelia]CAK69470.1 unnamed protein product [Paramecium tetraurelia]|eukprot:XP_001436867.1 hypothetical protein (macronuclear) [Paramecium tetraurelia strain d4-2]
MNQGEGIQFRWINVENKESKDYHALIEELEKQHKGKCLLFDQVLESLITSEIFVKGENMKLVIIHQIPTLIQNLIKKESEVEKLNKEIQDYRVQADKQHSEGKSIVYSKSTKEFDLEKKIKELEIQINKLQTQLDDQRQEKDGKIQKIQDSYDQNKKLLLDQNSQIERLSQELYQSKSQSQQQDQVQYNSDLEQRLENLKDGMKHYQLLSEGLKNELEGLKNDLKRSKELTDHQSIQLTHVQKELTQSQQSREKLQNQLSQSKEQINHLSIESQQLQHELSESKEIVNNQKIEIQQLQNQLVELKEQINYQNNSSDEQKRQSQKLQQTACELHKFCTDEEEQEDKQILENQIKFLDSTITKFLDQNKLIKDISLQIDRSQTFQKSIGLEIYQVTLKEQEFLKCINEKNFFFRQNCIYKKKCHYAQSINEKQMSIIAHGQQINIQKVFAHPMSNHEAIDTILNLLIVQGYFNLFQRDHLQNNMQQFQQIWNLKFPKQFLVKDQMDNYSVYQECLQTDIKIFIPFQNISPMDQYISSFFRYFYFATNKNFAISECQYGEQTNKNFGLIECQYGEKIEIIILSIIIHSNYEKGFSLLDQGRSKIEEFEKMLKAQEGINQRYWSDQLQNQAKKVWYEQK